MGKLDTWVLQDYKGGRDLPSLQKFAQDSLLLCVFKSRSRNSWGRPRHIRIHNQNFLEPVEGLLQAHSRHTHLCWKFHFTLHSHGRIWTLFVAVTGWTGATTNASVKCRQTQSWNCAVTVWPFTFAFAWINYNFVSATCLSAYLQQVFICFLSSKLAI